MKTPFIVPPDVGINATHGKVHLGKTPCGVVRLLPVHRDVAKASAVLAHERFRLDKHAAGTAAGIIDPPRIGFEHLHQHTHNGTGRVELPAPFALPLRQTAQENIRTHAPTRPWSCPRSH